MSKQNDMLGALIRAVVGVPVQFLGVTLDVVNKLSGKDGGYWYEKLRLLLREPAVVPALAAVAEVATQTLTVLANISLADRIAAGKYSGYINRAITEENLPHDPTSVGEWEWKIFHFGQISSEDATVAMVANDWQPAKLEHILVFGEKYPDEQRKYPIVGLGSSRVGGRGVPSLRGDDLGRSLHLDTWRADWRDNYRFLAVRKKV